MIEQDSPAAKPGHARLGSYELLDQLSDSHFGPRWRVRGSSDAPRALRVITTDAPERFASAAAAVRGVDHPSLLPPIELVRPGKGLVVVTEDVPGDTLRALLQRAVHEGESIPESITLRCVLDLLEALQALEQAELRARHRPHLHGGLTLDSIHVGDDGRTRLLDPGIAALAAREACFARNPVLAAYTAPEHLDGHLFFDARSDVFSIGVVLWEGVACRSLFGAPSYTAVVARVLHEPIPRVQRERFLRGEPVSAALAVVVARALQRDPERRFQSYAELIEALRDAGRVAEHAEVASFMRGGARSLPGSIVSSLPAPPVAAPGALSPAAELDRVELFDAALESESESDSEPPPPPSSPSQLLGLEPPLPPKILVELEPEMLVELEPDPPPSTPSARPERDRTRARLELLVGTLVLVIGLAALYAFWPRDSVASSPPSARPVNRVPVTAPKPPTQLPPSPAAATSGAPGTPEPATQAVPGAAPEPSTAAGPAPQASAAGVEPERPRPARARRAPKPAPAPVEYIPDGI